MNHRDLVLHLSSLINDDAQTNEYLDAYMSKEYIERDLIKLTDMENEQQESLYYELRGAEQVRLILAVAMDQKATKD